MQEVCGQFKGGNEKLAKLYVELVPKLITYYGKDDLAKFQTELYKQALAFLEKNDMQKQAAELRARAGR